MFWVLHTVLGKHEASFVSRMLPGNLHRVKKFAFIDQRFQNVIAWQLYYSYTLAGPACGQLLQNQQTTVLLFQACIKINTSCKQTATSLGQVGCLSPFYLMRRQSIGTISLGVWETVSVAYWISIVPNGKLPSWVTVRSECAWYVWLVKGSFNKLAHYTVSPLLFSSHITVSVVSVSPDLPRNPVHITQYFYSVLQD